MRKVYCLLVISLALVSIRGYSQTRSVSALLHETFETNSTTLSSWHSKPSSACTAYNWAAQNSSSKGALGSAGYWLYQSSAAASGCYATAVTPLLTINKVDNNDSIAVDFYIYRTATTATDYISVSITDDSSNIIYGPYAAFANDAKNPPSSAGWCHLTWNINYYDHIYNAIVSHSGSNAYFRVSFTAVSTHGVDLLLDEVTISHSYTHNAGISLLNTNSNFFNCYPNPAHNTINLQFSNQLTENTILNLYNLNGKQIMSKSIPAGTSQTSIDVQDIVNGLYILEVKNSMSVSRKEVLVN